MKFLNRQNVMILAAVVAALVLLRCVQARSNYALKPRSVSVSGPRAGSLFDLPYKMDCVPGPTKKAAYYTKDLSPGGVCGDQEFVQNQANYSIDGGIGGSLLDA